MPQSQNLTPESLEALKNSLFEKELKQLETVTSHVIYHQNRIGNDDQLRNSVAKILAGALREAEVEDHKELSSALSPLVIQGVRREISNSKGELIESIYPLMGKLMASYVSSHFHRFVQKTNNQLEKNLSPRHLRLRLQSLITGVPYRELLLKSYKFVEIEQLLLINKESGLLIDHWQSPDKQTDEDEQNPVMISSMLTAITQFSKEAFKGEQNELKALDFGKSCIYLIATPLHLMAIHCSGKANKKLENQFDLELINLIGQHNEILSQSSTSQNQLALKSILPNFAKRLNDLIIQEVQLFELNRFNRKPLYVIALFTLMTLMGTAWATNEYIAAKAYAETRGKIENTVSGNNAFNGFPVKVRLADDGKTAYLSGLSPSKLATDQLMDTLQQELGDIKIVNSLIPIVTENRLTQSVGTTLQKGLDITKHSINRLPTGSLEEKVSNLQSQLQALQTQLKKEQTIRKPIRIKKRVQESLSLQDTSHKLQHLSLPENPDFNDPDVKRNLQASQKLRVPKHLQKQPLIQGNKSETTTNNSNNNSTGSTTGNVIGNTTNTISNTTSTIKSTTKSLLGR